MTELDSLMCSSGFVLNITNKLDFVTELTKKELHNLEVFDLKIRKTKPGINCPKIVAWAV